MVFRNIPIWLRIALLLALPTSLFAQQPIKPLQVAFLHENPVGEGGWTLSHEKSRAQIDEYFGDLVQTSALDGVNPGVDAERVMTQLAREGKQLIFATSFGFLNPTRRVAPRFPNTIFEHASGYLTAKNVGTYQIRAYQGRYLSGVAAAMVSETGVLGYVGSFPIPEVVRGINAFVLGAQSVNPDIVIELVWINSWSDAGKAREAAELLIFNGADVITHHTESSSAIQAADQAGVWSIGYQSDRSAAAPNKHLVSVVHNWFPFYRKDIQAVLDGEWQSHSTWIGVEEDASQLVSWGASVPPEVIDLVQQVKQQMIDEAPNPFVGPLYDTQGQLMLEEGIAMDDEALLSMEWFVKGVEGQLP